jgi:hypothetical protein
MKKTTKKLRLPKETIRQLEVNDLDIAAGGAKTDTCLCASCGNRLSTCPV